MKILLLIIQFFVISIIATACYSTKLVHKVSCMEVLLSFSKSSCRGNCKVFTFSVYKKGFSMFVGAQNVEHIGTVKAQLNHDQVEDLVRAIEMCEFGKIDESYLSGARDLQVITIDYQGKLVRFHKMKAPDKLNDLVIHLDALISELSWQRITKS